MKYKITITVLVVLTILFTIFGSTLAYLNWQTSEEQRTNIVFTLEQDFWCSADGGRNITSADVPIAPASCTNSTHAIQREVLVTTTILRNNLTINLDLWLDVDNLDSGLANSENFKYAFTTSSTSCTEGVIASGNFNGANIGKQIEILNTQYSNSSTQKYYLYIWLDAAETSTSTMYQNFNLSINGKCTDAEEVEDKKTPTLDSGMIPVKLSDDGTVTTVLSSDSNWYDYENQKWANVVLVSDDSMSTYQNTTGVTVNQDDILAYYVWIPRYKYQIWTLEESSSGSEQTIDIVFEDKEEPMSEGTQVGEYRTHPAFWWDDDSDGVVDDGEMLAGIWVGKFETTGDYSTPTILPNVSPLTGAQVSKYFTTSQKFSASSNIYGLSNISTNAHMMKNSEWGAVAYLSHSVYGINGEIQRNNKLNLMTGCGGSKASASSTCLNPYGGSTSYTQSTTGNITGLFDISGGAAEYVMATLKSNDGSLFSGYTASSNSGFNGYVYQYVDQYLSPVWYSSGVSFPASKYYDVYVSLSSLTACDGGICYGHALSETSNWYNDTANYPDLSTHSWAIRGGGNSQTTASGAFAAGYADGSGNANYSWRSVLVVGYGV